MVCARYDHYGMGRPNSRSAHLADNTRRLFPTLARSSDQRREPVSDPVQALAGVVARFDELEARLGARP